jgi:predicted nucleotidyltransferase
MNHHDNKVRIKAVARALGKLNEKVVFVGGATISLYPKVAIEPRQTNDVDVIVEILTYSERAALEEKLREIGFVNVKEVICRWRIDGIIVDIMPTDDESIGFKNTWYPDAFKNAVDCAVDDCIVKILSAPYFIATKLEAFKSPTRENYGDGFASHDFEDIVYILENRDEIWDELKNTQNPLKDYLLSEFTQLLRNPNILDWIDGHVERVSPPATYFILDEMKKFIG